MMVLTCQACRDRPHVGVRELWRSRASSRQLDAPLVGRVDVREHALREYTVPTTRSWTSILGASGLYLALLVVARNEASELESRQEHRGG